MKRLLIALQFLTILPIRIKSQIEDADFGASLLYFPLVGLFIGLILTLGANIFSFLPIMVKSALVVILWIFITGAIHLDGLADTSDAFYGNRPKDKVLEIMRDSHVGVMAVVGVVVLLMLKFTLITSILDHQLWKALILAPVFSRWCQAVTCVVSIYARKEGKAQYFVEYARRKDIILGGIFTLCLFILLMQLKGLIIFISSLAAVLLFIRYINKRIFGVTGDIIGAVNEIAEVLVLLGAVAYAFK